MTWIPSQKRWSRMHRGQRFYVSCRQLKTAPTKEASILAANEWWRAKQAELTAAELPDAVAALRRQLAALPGESDGAPVDLATVVYSAVQDVLRGMVLQGGAPPTGLAPDRANQLADAAAAIRGESPGVPAASAVREQFGSWCALLRARASVNSLSADKADNNRIRAAYFVTWMGEGYAANVFAAARMFIRWLWESELIELPRNLDSKGWRFGNGAKSVPTWTPDEVRQVVGEAPGKLKLAMLLCLNCGMTQQDVSDLQDTEVDWRKGRIKRKRSKTASVESVPTVDYPLWPETFALLREYRSGKATVLLTESGRPLVRKELVNGRLVRVDGIAKKYDRLKERLEFRKPLKQLRKTAATLLESHETYGRFVGLFLGHAPASCSIPRSRGWVKR